ncbi:hypothetical protein KJ636_01535 [Patescibacteria group bacterium]|nr:hypothetical protein [Patescibacteria group bacterium]
MKKIQNKKNIPEKKETIITKLSKISEKREKERQELDRIAKMLVRRDFELMKTREELEEAKIVLEIKVQARTQELKELAEELEGKVRERTKGLEEKTKELAGSKTALLNILEDIEEVKDEVVEERDKTLSIINNLLDGLLVFNTENKLILINPRAENFLEVQVKEAVGKSISELAEFPNFKPLTTILGGGQKEIFRKELSFSENLSLEISGTSIMSGEKKLGNLIIMHDVSREKLIERMKTEFVSLSAHQLRTPLSAIKWTLRMLLDGDLGSISQEQRDILEKSYQSNERMINLINDLLNVTRIEEGRYLYKSIAVDLEEIVQARINSCKEKAEGKKIFLEFKKPEKKLFKVMLDVEKMELAIDNLLDNAISYTPQGGMVVISLKETEKNLEFSIKDTGIGIPAVQQKRLFTKFFRGTNAVRIDTEGTGLGLFITKNIIEAHGGKIWFESGEGKGTTFYFTLPSLKDLT